MALVFQAICEVALARWKHGMSGHTSHLAYDSTLYLNSKRSTRFMLAVFKTLSG